MLSSTARLSVPMPHQFAGESFPPPISASNFRQLRKSVISAAYSTAATAEYGSGNTATCVKPASPSSFYEVLGVPVGATNIEIKAAYRRLARVCHPDVATIDAKSSSADEFMKVHTAYSTLSDPAKRADYDRRLFRRVPQMSSRFSGFVSRNWETDQCW